MAARRALALVALTSHLCAEASRRRSIPLAAGMACAREAFYSFAPQAWANRAFELASKREQTQHKSATQVTGNLLNRRDASLF